MAEKELVVAACAVIIGVIARSRQKRRRRRIKTVWILNRHQHGVYHQLLQELRLSDVICSQLWRGIKTRISIYYSARHPSEGINISWRETCFDFEISSHWWVIKLRVIVYSHISFNPGETYNSLQYVYRIAPQTIGKIIPETCAAIVETFQEFLQVNMKKCNI